MITTFLVCVAFYSPSDIDTPISRDCIEIMGDYDATLALMIRDVAPSCDALVTYDNVIQAEFEIHPNGSGDIHPGK